MARSDDIRNQVQAKHREAESMSLKVQEFDEIIRKATQDREFYQQQHAKLMNEISSLDQNIEQALKDEHDEEERKRLQQAAVIAAANSNTNPDEL